MEQREENSIHAIVTDPLFGLIEYTGKHMEQMRAGRGGVWRLPPVLNGSVRKLPAALYCTFGKRAEEHQGIFRGMGTSALKVLVPGAHLFIASNPLLTPYLAFGLINAGFERRGEIIRLVRTLRGGDLPKLAEREYGNISVIPRSCYEPWGLVPKAYFGEKSFAESQKVGNRWFLRRTPDSKPFPDVPKERVPTQGRSRRCSASFLETAKIPSSNSLGFTSSWGRGSG